MDSEILRIALILEGQIQGVGFRPFVWRLAHELELSGSVRNSSAGVRIEIQGSADSIDVFKKRLFSDKPPLAEIVACHEAKLPIQPENSFSILSSEAHSSQKVLVSPDIGICGECLEELRDPQNFRFDYPFINCVNCGPRYSITAQIPYDRPTTVMRCFPLCDNCAKEYANPADRRFHAQPIACPECGPHVWFVDKFEDKTDFAGQESSESIAKACALLAEGKILALKGLGGFQLACDATNPLAVKRLREVKKRPGKAFALMVGDVADARKICRVGPHEEMLLASPARPIVLCGALNPGYPSAEIAPDSDELGLMLPNTPLHVLLFDRLKKEGLENPVLVMSSGNRPGEPICLGNREALEKLSDMADGWLLHNRDILVRVDDSVTAAPPESLQGGKESFPLMIRRARGYVPERVKLKAAKNRASILGTGAELKTTFCLSRGDDAFVSQHLGDLRAVSVLDFYEECLSHMQKLLESEPEAIVRDLHPDFLSSHFAEQIAKSRNIPIFALQHHAAHAASVLAENAWYEPALALCLDGSGLGTDGTIWGGELLNMDLSGASWQRIGSFAPFPLPGGEMAIKQPWRIALALDRNWQPSHLEKEAAMIEKMLQKNLGLVPSSSCGRLFDAMSARLGLCETVSYEGQAAMLLMRQANRNQRKIAASAPDLLEKNGFFQINSQEIFRRCTNMSEKRGVEESCAAFQEMLAENLSEMCSRASARLGIKVVGLSGGVFQNRSFSDALNKKLLARGLRTLWHKRLPPGDGGLSLGQAVWGRQLLNLL